MMLRAMGLSDAYMYYANSGRSTSMEIKIPLTMREPVNVFLLGRAADQALALFPEFAVRPVICGGKPMFEENHAPVRVITAPDDGTFSLDYGTEDTNGHVLFFLADSRDARRVTFCYYHAMSDFVGGMALLKTVLYRYSLLLGLVPEVSPEELAAAGVRTAVPDRWDRAENLDPYAVFGRPADAAGEGGMPPMAFLPPVEIYPWGNDYNHIYDVHLSSSAFHQKAKSFGTSFAPLLVCLLADAADSLWHAGSRPVGVALPIDMRPLFGANTVTNFSDSVLFFCTEEDRALPVSQRCAMLTKSLKEQRTADRAQPIIYGKAQQTRSFLEAEEGYLATAARLTALPAPGTPFPEGPVTLGLTYPGRLDLPACCTAPVAHVGVESVINLTKLFSIVSTCGDDMTVSLIQRFDGAEYAEALGRELDRLGLTHTLADRGRRRQDCMDPARLKVVEL